MSLARVINETDRFSSLAQILTADFEGRKALDPALTIRGYGRLLEIDSSTISQIMRGQRKLSSRLAHSIASKLGLKHTELMYLIEKQASSPDFLPTYDLRGFGDVSDWRDDAILEALNGKAVSQASAAITPKLGMSQTDFEEIKNRLLECELLTIENDIYVDRVGDVTSIVDAAVTNAAAKNYQLSVLESSVDALENVPAEKRNHTSTLLNIREEDLPAIVGFIKSLRRDIAKDFNCEAGAGKLHLLHVGLFPVEKE